MDIKIGEDQLSAYLHEAVVKALGEDSKALIISQVVSYLTTKPQSSSYDRTPSSPLMQAMNTAAMRVADKYIVDKMENDPDFKKQLDDLMKSAIEQVFVRKEDIAARMAEAMRKVLTGDRY